MRNATIVGTVTVLLALCAPACVAQDRDRQDNIPRGDYVQTCRNIHMDGDRLVAECQERDGDWRRTSLDDAYRCRGEIHNIDGNLTCGGDSDDRGDRRRDWRNGLPPGDYIQTCRNVSLSGDRLNAECQRRNGRWRSTSLDIDQCSGPVSNDNGNLVCPQGRTGYGNGDRDQGWQGGIPSGTYTQTCRNIHVEGDRLVAQCQERDGDWRQTALEDFRRCSSPPANDNGNLVCPQGGNGYDNNSGYRFGWRNGLPSGTYTQSCRNIRAKGYALAAECQTRSGSWRNTSLFNFDQCTGAIANDDGHLVCPK